MKPSEFRPDDWNYPARGAQAHVIRKLRGAMPDGYSAFWDRQHQATRPRWNPDRVRRLLLERQQCRCTACGIEWPDAYRELHERADGTCPTGFLPYEIDHVVSLADDGDHALSNMQLLCQPCHRHKTAAERPAGKPQPPKRTPAVLAALIERGPMTSHEIAAACELNVNQVTGPLVTLCDQREIRKLPGLPRRWGVSA